MLKGALSQKISLLISYAVCLYKLHTTVYYKSEVEVMANQRGGRNTLKMMLGQPLELMQLSGKYDITVKVNGGGLSGQAGAIRLGIARCIEKINPDNRLSLKQAGMLTRDSREVERKKYGRPGARKKFQFSKR